MNFTRRPCESRSPPQTFSNSSIEIFFVDAITEFFTITLFIFKLLNFLFLSCLPEASCSDWTMQRYGVFSDWPRFWRLFAFSYCMHEEDSNGRVREDLRRRTWREWTPGEIHSWKTLLFIVSVRANSHPSLPLLLETLLNPGEAKEGGMVFFCDY